MSEVAISRMFSATEIFVGSRLGIIWLTSARTLSSLVLVMCWSFPTMPFGSMSTGMMVT